MDLVTQIPDIQFELTPYTGEDKSWLYVPTDYANQYIIQLIKEKNAEGSRYAMTEGVILESKEDESVKLACDLLVDKYRDLLERHPYLEGIYTVINSIPDITEVSHQNWLFFDVPNKIIIRFEPNGPDFDNTEKSSRKKSIELYGDLYRFRDVLDCVTEATGISWKISDNIAINLFNGCRATSTILALMNLVGKSFETLKEMDKGYYQPLAIAVSESIRSCELPPLPRRKRTQKTLLSYVEPEIIRGDIVIDAPDFSKMRVYELKEYLRAHSVPFREKDLKRTLIEKAIRFQDTLVAVE